MILVVDCGSDKAKFIHEIVDEFMDVKTIPFHDLAEDELQNYKGIIFSGAPILVTEVDLTPYLDKVAWLKTIEIPVLGICFGHQLLGITFGSFASMMREDRDWQMIGAFEESILFNRLPSEVRMMQDHCETISIPPGFKLIGSSDLCVNEVMQHNEKPLYGVQFHPEVSGNHGRVMLENFIKVCQ